LIIAVLDNDVAGARYTEIVEPVRKDDQIVQTPRQPSFLYVNLTSEPIAIVNATAAVLDSEAALIIGSQYFIFTPQNWTATALFQIYGQYNEIKDGDKNFSISVTFMSADPNYNNRVVISNCTLIDTNIATFNHDIYHLEISEPNRTSSFIIWPQSAPTKDLNLSFVLVGIDATKLRVTPSVLLFTPLNWRVRRTVLVSPIDNFVVDGTMNATIYEVLATSDPNYAAADVIMKNISVLIFDDDSSDILVTQANGSTFERGGNSSFMIRLNSQPISDVLVTATSMRPLEGIVSPQTSQITFNATNWHVWTLVIVVGVDDVFIDGAQAYNISIVCASADPQYNNRHNKFVEFVNADDDKPGVTFSKSSVTVHEPDSGANFTVRLNSQPYHDVVLIVKSLDSSRAEVMFNVTITPSMWNHQQSVHVHAVDNKIMEGTQTVIIQVDVLSLDRDYNVSAFSNLTCYVTDFNIAAFNVSIYPQNISEAGQTAIISIILNSRPRSPVNFTLLTTLPDKNTFGNNGLLVVMPYEWNVYSNIFVVPIDNWLVDGTLRANITIMAKSLDLNYNVLMSQVVYVDILDNDTAFPVVSEVRGVVNILRGAANFTVKLHSQPYFNVSFDVFTTRDDQALLSINNLVPAKSVSITLTQLNWYIPIAIQVHGQNDRIINGNNNFTVMFSNLRSRDTLYDGQSLMPINLTNFQVLANADLYKTVPVGSVTLCTSGTLCTFVLQARDSFWNAITEGDTAYTFEILNTANSSTQVVSNLVDAGYGSSNFTYITTRAGNLSD